MRSTFAFRSGLVAVALGAAMAASAQVNITLVSVGSFAGASPEIYSESVVYQSHPGFSDLSTYVETYYSDTDDFATYTSANLASSMTIEITNGTYIYSGGLYAEAANWTYVSGTGAWAGLAGGGTYTQNGNDIDFSSTTSIKGDLVPEPATFVVMGVGALGLLLRRRSKKA